MATQADVRRIALALPETQEEQARFAFHLIHRGRRRPITWVWMERVEAKRPRVPNPGVIALRVAGLAEKDSVLALDPAKFFTEPHYDGYPAVLVRLEAIDDDELEDLITDAWRCQAPRALVKEFDR